MAILVQRSLTGFALPQDVAISADGARIAVIESMQHRVRWASLPAAATFTGFGAYATQGAGFALPEAGAFDAAGNLLVLDLWNRRVVRHLTQGNGYAYDNAFAPATTLGHARDLAIDAAGAVYVLDGDNDRIVKIDGAVSTIPLPAGLRAPWGLALRAGGGFLVCDRGGHRVVGVSATGSQLFSLGGFGRGNGQLRFPEHVAVAPNGLIWVADTDNQRIQEFSATGTFVRVVIAAQQFRQIRRMRFAANGWLYVTDPGSGAIHEVADAVPQRGVHIGRDHVAFGDVELGATSDSILTLSNIGSTAVQIQAVTVSGPPYAVTTNVALPVSVPVGASQTIRVSFSPIVAGPVSGVLEVISNGIQNLRTVGLGGTGIRVPDVSVGIVIDRSRSLNGRFREIVKLEHLKQLLQRFPPVPPIPPNGRIQFGAATFTLAAELVLPLGPLEAGRIAGAIEGIPPGEGLASFGAGIEGGLALLDGAKGRRVLIVLTGGGSDYGPALEDLRLPGGVELHVIGLGDPSEMDVVGLSKLTRRTGGSFLLTGSDADALPFALAQVSADVFGHEIVTTKVTTFRQGDKDLRIPIHGVGPQESLGVLAAASASGAPLATRLVPPKGKRGEWTLLIKRGKGWTQKKDVSVAAAVVVQSDVRLRLTPALPLLQRARPDGSAPGDAPELEFAVGDRLAIDVRLTERGVGVDSARASAGVVLLPRTGSGGPEDREAPAAPVPLAMAGSPLLGATGLRGTTNFTKAPGAYVITVQVHARAQDGQKVARERTIVMAVSPDLSVIHSEIEFKRLPTRGDAVWRLRTVPRDRFGTPLGPGWARDLSVIGDGAIALGSVRDHGDGSYSVDVAPTVGERHPGELVLQLRQSWMRVPLPTREAEAAPGAGLP